MLSLSHEAEQKLEFSLGEEWFKVFYPILEEKLHYSYQKDAEARDALGQMLESRNFHSSYLSRLGSKINGKIVLVVGAGPSLEHDLDCLSSIVGKNSLAVFAADGAIDALAKVGIFPLALISDLDSASEKQLIEQSEQRFLFVHAHGDNLRTIRKLVPKFGNGIFGTTQVESINLVKDFGGLTDGDRACYIASALKPKAIVLAGMDFGSQEGEYSKARRTRRKGSNQDRRKKLDLGLKSLEFLIEKIPSLKFFNLTAKGEPILGAMKVNCEELLREIS